jgi:hypothetical protein
VRFDPTVLASERAKAVHALDRWATVTGLPVYREGKKNLFLCPFFFCSYFHLLLLLLIRKIKKRKTK